MPLRCRLLLPALLAAASLTGCGGVGDKLVGQADDPVNSTDAAFVRAMVEHQRAVGTIARLGTKKALREELRAIAKDTLGRHGQNARDLDWLARALRGRRIPLHTAYIREGPPRFNARGLRNAVSFDHEFMVSLILQYEYAVRAADVERRRGGDERIKALAEDIHESSRKDLARLRHWLRTWYGDDTLRGVPRGPAPAPSPGGGGGGAAPAPDPDV